MIERKIKELSFALEALSRINSADEPFTRVARLLDYQIHQAEEDRRKEQSEAPKTDDDDIPF